MTSCSMLLMASCRGWDWKSAEIENVCSGSRLLLLDVKLWERSSSSLWPSLHLSIIDIIVEVPLLLLASLLSLPLLIRRLVPPLQEMALDSCLAVTMSRRCDGRRKLAEEPTELMHQCRPPFLNPPLIPIQRKLEGHQRRA
eukprot:GHVU01041524.1.p2 GENE.GHVU01041524.1~~GHVU01041524.1.p2  ORF type:complete len:141 (-),score=11.56 GHVU01041524.1:2850-3272(-)